MSSRIAAKVMVHPCALLRPEQLLERHELTPSPTTQDLAHALATEAARAECGGGRNICARTTTSLKASRSLQRDLRQRAQQLPFLELG